MLALSTLLYSFSKSSFLQPLETCLGSGGVSVPMSLFQKCIAFGIACKWKYRLPRWLEHLWAAGVVQLSIKGEYFPISKYEEALSARASQGPSWPTVKIGIVPHTAL